GRNPETRNVRVIGASMTRRHGASVGRDDPLVTGRWSEHIPSRRPGGMLMTSCPSDEQLTGLLTDSLSPAERDAVARHVEGCVSCQAQLARLTGSPDTEMWHRAEHPPRDRRAEEGLMSRLKRMLSPLTPSDQVEAAKSAGRPAAVGCEQPAVPGFEIL